MSDATLDILRELKRLRSDVERLKTIERPIVICWLGSSAGAPAAPTGNDTYAYYDTIAAQVYVYANAGWIQIS